MYSGLIVYSCLHYFDSNGIELKEHIEDIFATWKNINPKIHFSTPKNKTKKEISIIYTQ